MLAHLAEMVRYWHGELNRVATSGRPEPVPFGRIATDADRLGHRARPVAPAGRAVRRGSRRAVTTFVAHWSRWPPAERARLGLHPTRGEITVAAGADRFIAGHLDEHAVQLEAILGATQAGG